ncbi:hypothetical protein HYH02_014128 [Chlamydomonas schloesseri]|uniref:Uncharacterized protein n=1 Tax=Chlamydomonas schloesseri TaxID=2026947 RepID=A0A835SYN8_9CHLO|nr:hypothetical protein HYH02_014128 [Chlamydomonas schloesseri]|eukprot:KAG2429195.1 hypothetical protein HYH02_014128 [Chlamydomonas schloesseri]
MSDKADLNLDVAAVSGVDGAVLASLKVGQRLHLVKGDGHESFYFQTEAGVQLAPLGDPGVAARFPLSKVIVRALKREAGTGTIQQLQVRVYRSDEAPGSNSAAGASTSAPGATAAAAHQPGVPATAAGGGGGAGSANAALPSEAGPSAAGAAGGGGGGGGGGGDGSTGDGIAAADEAEYKLRREQYLALAGNPELRQLLSDPRLQGVLGRIDGAADREKALAAQLESPDFQGFVSQVLMSLGPDRVPATAATAAAVEMRAAGGR